LTQRYENTMSSLQSITRAGYRVRLQWECEFELPENAEVELREPFRMRDALYGGCTEAILLHYRVKEDEETL
jgi:G:T-mismatch repair DNA endonuclease (very short patch repair protein)